MHTGNPYNNVSSENVAKELMELQKTIYDAPTMLSCLLHLSSSPNPSVAEKAKAAYQALLEVKDEAITAKAYANQRLVMDFEEMSK